MMNNPANDPSRKMPLHKNARWNSSALRNFNNVGAKSNRSKQEKEKSKPSTSSTDGAGGSKQQTSTIGNNISKRDQLLQMYRKTQGVKSTLQEPKGNVVANKNNIIPNNNKHDRFQVLKFPVSIKDCPSRKDSDEHENQLQQETDKKLNERKYVVNTSMEKKAAALLRGNSPDGADLSSDPVPNVGGMQTKRLPKCDPTNKTNTNKCCKIKNIGGPLQHIEEVTKVSRICTAMKEDKVELSQFKLISLLGIGGYGSVFLVRKLGGDDNGTLYAMKVIKKDHVIQKKSVAEHTRSEREVLEAIQQSPFLVQLHYAFQSNSKLYLILDYACGGDIFSHIQKVERFPEDSVRFYIAEVVLALERLHELGIIYRDIKLENILLDRQGHIVIADFGLAKLLDANSDSRAYSCCGTPRYMAPEILKRDAKGYDFAADWWSVGILTYELLTGTSPFITEGKKGDKNYIQKFDPEVPSKYSEPVKDLIYKMLQKDPTKRLGGNSKNAAEIKSHPFFDGINWNELGKKRLEAPIKPQLVSEEDTQNFNPQFTSQPAIDKPALSPSYEYTHELFRGYSYVAPPHMKSRFQRKNNHNVEYCNEPIKNPPLCPNTLMLDKLVKSGSFGSCYLITDNDKKTTHVAKVIPEVLYNATEVDALISCGINGHNNICQYIDTFRNGSNIWIVMEYIEGGELKEYIDWSGGLPEPLCRDIFRQVCDAVQYMHSRNFIHGDLKPENILFTDAQKKHVKIVDFGAACYKSSCTTWKDFPRYTLDYAPPEALEDAQLATYSKAFDIWCLGATLFAMYAGHPPFRCNRDERVSDLELIKRILNMKVQKNSSRWTNASSNIRHLVLRKCLIKKLEERATIEELRGSYLLYKSLFE